MMLTASCIFILLGAVCVIGSLIWSICIQKDEKYKGKANGTIAGIEAGVPDEKGIAAGIHDYYYPVVAFYANGRLCKLRYHKGSNPGRYTTGDRVMIRYDESDPSQFEITTNGRNNRISSLLYYSGLIFCCIGGLFFLLFATRY